MEIVAKATYLRAKISPKKVAPVMDMVRGLGVRAAKVALSLDTSKAAKMVLKTLNSAEANAKSSTKVKSDNLFLTEIWVSGGPVTKSGEFVGRGRFNPLLKRTSHIYIGLGEKGN